ncbi:phosphomethylpyrimidine synthase ThiC [uncultured Methanospirillum sp.]|uniref:phosphomethylpyrimidine synthase ThiC n=1 Tax=uncultured Methanospirillum sp. TaxID=262503 RepID=UPI0029C782E1|nr:phosphomethylpyrimidine synthase ThiC [uncultured Methanospirillum sp.]
MTPTLIQAVQKGTIPSAVYSIAASEGVPPEYVQECIASGSIVIMQRDGHCAGIGKGLRTKINVNLGTSSSKVCLDDEIKKAQIAEKFGADTISDLSMGGDIERIRKTIFSSTSLPITTVPVYQTVSEIGLKKMTADDIIETVRSHAEEGMSSLVIHTVTSAMLAQIRKRKRILGVVSKGGSITSAFMAINECENPFIEHFDTILQICQDHDIVLSLGNTARSGCINDQRDMLQRMEEKNNVILAEKAHAAGVQVIIEGAGGHIRLDRIAPMIRRYKKMADFPLFVAGPLPTDIGVGYDHIAGCAGASTASAAGADYLCYITPAEHLGLPTVDAVKEGLIAFRIAAHIGDTVKSGVMAEDRSVAMLRSVLDREGQVRCAIDPERASSLSDSEPECTMCGEFCAIKIIQELR